jgi:hypothetical protein
LGRGKGDGTDVIVAWGGGGGMGFGTGFRGSCWLLVGVGRLGRGAFMAGRKETTLGVLGRRMGVVER